MLPFLAQNTPGLQAGSGLIKHWTYTIAQNYSECPYRAYKRYVANQYGPQAEAANRGQQMHDNIEQYIRGNAQELGVKVNPRAVHIIDTLREKRLSQPELVLPEDKWGFDSDLKPCNYYGENIWLRVKQDIFLRESPTSAICFDWKSGKKIGKEGIHRMQAQLYTIASFLRFPELEFMKTQWEYIDQGKDNYMICEYSRDKAMMYLNRWVDQGRAITSTTKFDPRPNRGNCRFCQYNTPECPEEQRCPYGVQE